MSSTAVGGHEYDIYGDAPSAGDISIYDRTAAAYRFTIKSTGEVGISDQSPSYTLDVGGNIAATGTAYYGDAKEMLRFSDGWLRLNPNNDFTSGIYAGTGILRTDGTLQVGSGGGTLSVVSGGNAGIGTA
ncbi:MAG TPA: hypothetical protein DEP87_03045, partial [Candidatus Pacebacteria bacterium]|nr:hypothetical protein [Candidatus Paceibacterota bacterium]